MIAVQELSRTGAEDVNMVIPALIGALQDRKASVRNEAALALGHCLEAALNVRGAGLSGQARTVAAALMAILERDGDLSVRASAAFAAASLICALKKAGINPDQSKSDDPIDPRTITKAFDAALARDPAARLVILTPYQRLGPIDDGAPAVLTAALDDPSRLVRIQALLALSQFSSGVDAAVPVLLKEAEFKEPRTPPSEYAIIQPLRQAAAGLHPTSAVIPMLIKGLGSQNAEVSSVAAVLLRNLGPEARSAAPALRAAARAIIHSSQGSPKPSTQLLFSDVASTIVQVLPTEDAVAILGEALVPGQEATQADAAFALAELGPRAHTAVPILVQALKDAGKNSTRSDRARDANAVIWSLQRIAPDAELSRAMADEVVEAVSRSLDHPQDFVRVAAANTLGEFAHRALAALPRLRALRTSASEPLFVRDAASRAIKKIEETPHSS